MPQPIASYGQYEVHVSLVSHLQLLRLHRKIQSYVRLLKGTAFLICQSLKKQGWPWAK